MENNFTKEELKILDLCVKFYIWKVGFYETMIPQEYKRLSQKINNLLKNKDSFFDLIEENNSKQALCLTKEELSQLSISEWVWIETLNPFQCEEKVSGYYRKINDWTKGKAFCCGYPGVSFSFNYEDYGVTWLAYKAKP